jgi:hypothetical protein
MRTALSSFYDIAHKIKLAAADAGAHAYESAILPLACDVGSNRFDDISVHLTAVLKASCNVMCSVHNTTVVLQRHVLSAHINDNYLKLFNSRVCQTLL